MYIYIRVWCVRRTSVEGVNGVGRARATRNAARMRIACANGRVSGGGLGLTNRDQAYVPHTGFSPKGGRCEAMFGPTRGDGVHFGTYTASVWCIV